MPGSNGAALGAQQPGRTMRAADIIRQGVQTTAALQSVALTGQTVGQQFSDQAHPHSKDDSWS